MTTALLTATMLFLSEKKLHDVWFINSHFTALVQSLLQNWLLLTLIEQRPFYKTSKQFLEEFHGNSLFCPGHC